MFTTEASHQKLTHLLIYMTLLALPPFSEGQLSNHLSDEFINFINSQNLSWTARRNFDQNTSEASLRRLGGTDDSDRAQAIWNKEHKLFYRKSNKEDIPKIFDAREKWPVCKVVIGNVRDQGECGSSWGFSVAEVASDRLCIETKGKTQVQFSPEDVIACCEECKVDTMNGCEGGFPLEAWHHWNQEGFVSGGDYKSNEGCRPYSKSSMKGIRPTPCENKCSNSNYKTLYEKDKLRGAFSYVLPNDAQQVQMEIMKYGPVSTYFGLYDDFYQYEKGIYIHVAGKNMGSHTVKIIGWGLHKKRKYWLLTNSWGKNWGNNGLFKLPRGDNYLGIEEHVSAGRSLKQLFPREFLTSQVTPSVTCLSHIFVVFSIVVILF